MSTGPLNSSAPTTSILIGGVYNLTSPAPSPGQALPFQLDANGNILVNIAAGAASGTQYADGTTQATPTGTVALGKNPSNILHALGLSAAGNLNVNLAEGTISGGNAAASATGSAVPVNADYQGVNIGGNLVGVTGLALGATTKAPTVAIVDGSGNQITSFGGGTQFADNAASGATPTGTLSMGWDSVNSKIRALKVDASQDLFVAFSSAQHVIIDSATLGTVTVAGTVTANQGTANATPWNENIAQFGGSAVTLGTKTSANSIPVVLASDEATVNVSVQNATLAVTQSTSPWVTSDNHLPAAVALGDALANPTTTEIGANLLGWDATNTVWRRVQVDAGTGTLKVDGSGSTQPVSGTIAVTQSTSPWVVSGTVTANQGGSWTVAATQGSSPWTDNVSQFGGSNVVTGTGVSGAGIPRVTVSSDSFPATQAVSIAATVNVSVQNATLAVTQSTSPWVVSGTVTANQGTANATPWNENVAQFGGSAVVTGTGVSGAGIPRVTVSSDSFPATQAVTGTFFQATQPVSVASLPLPVGASTDQSLVSGNDLRSQQTILLEAMRRALVAIACDGGRNNPRDFDPGAIAQEEGVDDYAD